MSPIRERQRRGKLRLELRGAAEPVRLKNHHQTTRPRHLPAQSCQQRVDFRRMMRVLQHNQAVGRMQHRCRRRTPG